MGELLVVGFIVLLIITLAVAISYIDKQNKVIKWKDDFIEQNIMPTLRETQDCLFEAQSVSNKALEDNLILSAAFDKLEADFHECYAALTKLLDLQTPEAFAEADTVVHSMQADYSYVLDDEKYTQCTSCSECPPECELCSDVESMPRVDE
jgi:H2-forming N5,N10-methylenetetrahydromethanopterin dehydrogenase-like enzyme